MTCMEVEVRVGMRFSPGQKRYTYSIPIMDWNEVRPMTPEELALLKDAKETHALIFAVNEDTNRRERRKRWADMIAAQIAFALTESLAHDA